MYENLEQKMDEFEYCRIELKNGDVVRGHMEQFHNVAELRGLLAEADDHQWFKDGKELVEYER